MSEIYDFHFLSSNTKHYNDYTFLIQTIEKVFVTTYHKLLIELENLNLKSELLSDHKL